MQFANLYLINSLTRGHNLEHVMHEPRSKLVMPKHGMDRMFACVLLNDHILASSDIIIRQIVNIIIYQNDLLLLHKHEIDDNMFCAIVSEIQIFLGRHQLFNVENYF